MQIIGRMIAGQVIAVEEECEYLACTLQDCRIVKDGPQRTKFYDCLFERCQFEGFTPAEWDVIMGTTK